MGPNQQYIYGDKKLFAYFDTDTRMKYAAAALSSQEVQDPEVICWVSPKLGNRIKKVHPVAPGLEQHSTVKQSDVAQVAYLDVGRWGGGGAWPAQRCFGVSNGRTVFLLSYDSRGVPGEPEWEPRAQQAQPMKEAKAIEPLLRQLSSDKRLGRVHVRSASWSDITPVVPDEAYTYIFLGDLHLPVVTDIEDLGVWGKKTPLGRESSDEHYIRYGRLPHSTAVGLAPYDIGTGANDAPGKDTHLKRYDELEDTFSKNEALDWYDDFRFHDSRTKGSDIWEGESGASEDLHHFLALIRQAVDNKIGGRRIRFTQLGDCYELWVGMQNVWHAPQELQKEWVSTWMGELHKKTNAAQRDMLAALSDVVAKTGGKILVGNHDDYMGLLGGSSAVGTAGLIAEHGHQYDVFNNKAGRDKGWVITQMASQAPVLRALEAPGTGLLAWLLGPKYRLIQKKAPRLTAMERAVHKCAIIKRKHRRAVYAMGHTHQTTTKCITLRIGDPDLWTLDLPSWIL